MRKRIRQLLTGKKFGKLTAIEYKGSDKFRNALWLCQCDCGNKIIVKGTLIKTGKIVSCGKCENKYEFINPQGTEIKNSTIIGEKFGKLLVLDEYRKERNGYKITLCKCQCDCGNIKEINKASIVKGLTKSCGCLKKETATNNLYSLKLENIGKRIGRLTVQEYDIEKKKWKCLCDCGNIVYLKRLNGNTKSCGCLKKDNNKKKKEV